MKIVFVSNYFNHHQQPLSDALYALTDGQYVFIATTPLSEERRRLGYGKAPLPPYVQFSYPGLDAWRHCRQLIEEADVVIAGSAPYELLRGRIRQGKLLFCYHERPLKKGFSVIKYLPRLILWRHRMPQQKPIYLLCAGAYVARDYDLFGMYRGKCFRWGYFPEAKHYPDLEGMLGKKASHTLLWCGRMIHWKHPDHALQAVKRLRQEGYDLRLRFVGTGQMEAQLKAMAAQWNLEDCVTFCGPMPPEQVRAEMEQSGIYLFTSDRQEGWGAVVNEAMNSGCAVVASHAPGVVPYLLRDGENGLIYESGNVDALCQQIRMLLDDPDCQRHLGRAAYETIAQQWNGPVAAQRFIELAAALLRDEPPQLPPDGPCSQATVLEK